MTGNVLDTYFARNVAHGVRYCFIILCTQHECYAARERASYLCVPLQDGGAIHGAEFSAVRILGSTMMTLNVGRVRMRIILNAMTIILLYRII